MQDSIASWTQRNIFWTGPHHHKSWKHRHDIGAKYAHGSAPWLQDWLPMISLPWCIRHSHIPSRWIGIPKRNVMHLVKRTLCLFVFLMSARDANSHSSRSSESCKGAFKRKTKKKTVLSSLKGYGPISYYIQQASSNISMWMMVVWAKVSATTSYPPTILTAVHDFAKICVKVVQS